MRIARFLLSVGGVAALLAAGCVRAISKPRMAEQDVIRVAKAEMVTRFPDSVAAHEPYHAEFKDGAWSVWGTVPAGVRGGGAPEATVRDSDGRVTEVHLSR
jgi:hypothetical protein